MPETYPFASENVQSMKQPEGTKQSRSQSVQFLTWRSQILPQSDALYFSKEKWDMSVITTGIFFLKKPSQLTQVLNIMIVSQYSDSELSYRVERSDLPP